ncbi:MAG TPA: hypothetical protein VL202_24815 [Pararhizobium sp.]|uniref:hypothetical protein n=1 Tax=Pararhizobium sp. TaxID=1977563 RepID=UPI002D0D15E8|nr:hypothetical protein [Pararhizobium sp.]HTO34364.1 hypothetical protein [Pararhizobium sp.]
MIRYSKVLTVVFAVAAGVCLVAWPYRLDVSGFKIVVSHSSALAKDGNNGNGGSSGSGNNGGGNGNGGGKENRGSNEGTSNQGKSDAGAVGAGPKDGKAKGSISQDRTAGMEVRHSDGISEEIREGRYIMKDNRGRTIVNRRATFADTIRLRFLVR